MSPLYFWQTYKWMCMQSWVWLSSSHVSSLRVTQWHRDYLQADYIVSWHLTKTSHCAMSNDVTQHILPYSKGEILERKTRGMLFSANKTFQPQQGLPQLYKTEYEFRHSCSVLYNWRMPCWGQNTLLTENSIPRVLYAQEFPLAISDVVMNLYSIFCIIIQPCNVN